MKRNSSSRQLRTVLDARARAMRASPTFSEHVLWQVLRGERLGVRFRRQMPLGRFIVDLVAPRERLVVEVDGGIHAHRVAADARRDERLRRLGYRVLRVSAEEVVHRLPEVVERVHAALRE